MQQRKPEIRVYKEPIKLEEMVAFNATCSFCGDGLIKMLRDNRTFELLPDRCHCLLCGQRYFMEIEDLESWEMTQWQQKSELE